MRAPGAPLGSMLIALSGHFRGRKKYTFSISAVLFFSAKDLCSFSQEMLLIFIFYYWRLFSLSLFLCECVCVWVFLSLSLSPPPLSLSLSLFAMSCYIVDGAWAADILLIDPRLPLCLFRLMKNDSSALIEFYSFLTWSILRGAPSIFGLTRRLFIRAYTRGKYRRTFLFMSLIRVGAIGEEGFFFFLWKWERDAREVASWIQICSFSFCSLL